MFPILLLFMTISCQAREPTCRGDSLSNLKEILKECKGVDMSEIVKVLDTFRDDFRKEVDQTIKNLRMEFDKSQKKTDGKIEKLEKFKEAAIKREKNLVENIQDLQRKLNETQNELLNVKLDVSNRHIESIKHKDQLKEEMELAIRGVSSQVESVNSNVAVLKNSTEKSISALTNQLKEASIDTNRAKEEISNIEAKVKAHHSDINKLKKLVHDDHKLTQEDIHTLQSNWSQAMNTLNIVKSSLAQVDKQTTALSEKFIKIKGGVWPKDSFCIFKNGRCPVGFRFITASTLGQRYQGHGQMADFGDSYIRRYPRNPYYREMRISVCCK